jgi:hypothetical protein
MSRRLHEIGLDVDPQLTMRVASGKNGSATINSSWSKILAWMQANLTIPTAPTIGIASINIGFWDMDTNGSKTVNIASLGIVNSQILSITARIISDDFPTLHNDLCVAYTAVSGQISWPLGSTTDVFLSRITDSIFDSVNYNSGVINRGWLTIIYTF